jgi:hypothetical protein
MYRAREGGSMIKYVLPVAVAAFGLGAPLAQAQTLQPMQLPTPSNVTNANATIIGQPQPGPNDYDNPGYAAPMPRFYAQPISPRTTWIPGHYDWDPTTSNYAWTDGHYAEAPRENAQWIPGHWAQTPSSWIWINGIWN